MQRLLLQTIAEELKARTERQLPAAFRIARQLVRVFVQIAFQFEQKKRRIGGIALLQLGRKLCTHGKKCVRHCHPGSQ